MHRHQRSYIIILLAVVLFSACSKAPENASYIPKDAVAVAGINLRSLSKKIAWNVITGSKLFKEIQKRVPQKNAQDAVAGIEKAGLDVSSTFYVYVKKDSGTDRITGLIPLSSAADWEAYVKQVFPNVQVKQHGDRKEAILGDNMYAGWNSRLLVLESVNRIVYDEDAENAPHPAVVADISAEMDRAFAVGGSSAITGDKRFMKLEGEGHDLTFWLNYGQILSQYGGDMANKMGGLSLSMAMWKDAAFASGFDFKKGKITGDMRYYMPDDMASLGKEFSSANADKDMLDRLPGNNMSMLMAMHLAPKGIKGVLEKTGLLGLANVGLSGQGMNADYVLDAFTGDMALVMNDLKLDVEVASDEFMGQTVVHKVQKPSVSVSYVMKINKKENFDKLIQLAAQTGLQRMGNGFVMPISEKDSAYMLVNDKYLVVSNKYAYANGILNGDLKGQKLSSAAAATVYGHPVALYFDMQQLLKDIDPAIGNTAHDSAMIVESKKLLKDISVTGGEFKDGAFEMKLDVSFTNTDENSIINLIDYGMRMNDAYKTADGSTD